MSNKGRNRSILIWLLLLVGLGFALWLAFRPSETITETLEPTIQEAPPEYPEEIYDGPGAEVPTNKGRYIPQYSEDNPRPESVDPFTPHDDFEVLVGSTKNRKDFEFDFRNMEEFQTYKLNDGTIDFKLLGSVKTLTELENNVSLTLEFCKNDQISFTKRKVFDSFDLSFIKETERKTKADKLLYSFDFEQKLESIERGLYYFLIIPEGRNRVLYCGKFQVK